MNQVSYELVDSGILLLRFAGSWRHTRRTVSLHDRDLFGLARLGHTDDKGKPYPLQLALTAREFSDVLVFRSPPLAVQRALFGALGLVARWRGYRGTYPQLSRIVLAPRTQRQLPERTVTHAEGSGTRR